MLVVLLGVSTRVPLAQFFQILVLFSEVFHNGGQSLDLSLKRRHAWFVSLNVVGGRR